MHAMIDGRPATLSPARTAHGATYRLDGTGEWIAEVDVLPDGAVEITEAEYDSRRADIEAYNDALPEPEPSPPPGPTLDERLADLETRLAAVESR